MNSVNIFGAYTWRNFFSAATVLIDMKFRWERSKISVAWMIVSSTSKLDTLRLCWSPYPKVKLDGPNFPHSWASSDTPMGNWYEYIQDSLIVGRTDPCAWTYRFSFLLAFLSLCLLMVPTSPHTFWSLIGRNRTLTNTRDLVMRRTLSWRSLQKRRIARRIHYSSRPRQSLQRLQCLTQSSFWNLSISWWGLSEANSIDLMLGTMLIGRWQMGRHLLPKDA